MLCFFEALSFLFLDIFCAATCNSARIPSKLLPLCLCFLSFLLLEDFLGFKSANSSSAYFLWSSPEELSLDEELLLLALLFPFELLALLLDLCSELSTSEPSLLTLLRDRDSLSLDEEDSDEEDLFFLFFRCFLDLEWDFLCFFY